MWNESCIQFLKICDYSASKRQPLHNTAKVYIKRYIFKSTKMTENKQEHVGKETIEADDILEAACMPDNRPYKWRNIIIVVFQHIMALCAIPILFFAKWQTLLFNIAFLYAAEFGVTGGAHRLWSHKSYKANAPLRFILTTCFAAIGMNSVYMWVRDHRLHHKFSDTDADPYNASRGLFYSHIGWVMYKKHPQIRKREKLIDMRDIENDAIVMFQHKYFWHIWFLMPFIVPICIPILLWNESFWISYMVTMFRWTVGFHFIFSINSLAHTFGTKPYKKDINPAQNTLVNILAVGEGFHNYHHAFPWDYKAAELSHYRYNFTTMFIDFFAKIGWAYDLKQPSKELVMKTVLSTGDGSHPEWGHVKEVPMEADEKFREVEKDKGI